ncbi:hypothetical protein Ndes2526B_g04125 [Nannochloris sp. 'desiccata']|nr:hypothetical protein KSW81_001094 [Chlorella desiccata (nom. nud.)]
MAPSTQSSINNDGDCMSNKKSSSPSQNESLEDLKRRVAVLEQEKLQEERARNYAQLERDRVLEFWEITKTRLAAAQKALHWMSLEFEQHEFQHCVDIKAYRDRIRALVADNAAREAELQATYAAALEQNTAEMEASASETRERCKKEVAEARIKQNEAENAVFECKTDCQRQINAQRLASDKEISAIQLRYDEALQTRIAAAEECCHSSMYGAAQQRDTALAKASAAHEATLRQAKEEQAATVAAQLDLIAALKNDVAVAKQKEAVSLEEIRKLQKKRNNNGDNAIHQGAASSSPTAA